ncbi:MAG: 4-(cytidine 5'-diphospho)-2-C-methyl-D-erythritol kinase [Caldisericia bacterium]|nr:4-(cytidine 5'-diphospho)-2-C-methyl-D-erythritol kinase [Caldisericia bacterium]
MKFLSEAKINLTLDILSKLPDGYHSIKSLVLKIPLYDEIYFEFGENKVIYENIVIENDIVEKAKKKFFEKTKLKDEIIIKIRKNIPIGSGLGGGSSNAARVLKSLNQIYKGPLDEDTLLDIGKELGSDVNLFLRDEKLLLIEGKGEKVFPVYAKDREFFFSVVYPKIRVSTKDVYRSIDKIIKKDIITDKVLDKILLGNDFIQYLKNDLEEYSFKIKPELKELKEILLKHFSINVVMSGSGSSFVCFFNSPHHLYSQAEFLKKFQFDVFLFHVLGWEKIYRIDMQI